jgi:hypothetical protein
MSIGELEGATEINNLLKFESLIKKYHSLNSKVISLDEFAEDARAILDAKLKNL